MVDEKEREASMVGDDASQGATDDGLGAHEERLKALDDAQRAVDSAFSTGRADRAKITQAAQLEAAEAVAMAGIAMEADEAADEAARITVIAEKSGDRARAREARAKERAARKKARADHRAATKSAKQAYDAIKFSAPNKLGFMRAVQVIFALHILIVLLMLILTSRDSVSYSTSNISTWITIILEGVAFWFFINRYRVARPFVIGMALFSIAVEVGVAVAAGSFNLFSILFGSIFDIFLILYFTFSDRVKAVLVNDMSLHEGFYDRNGGFTISRRGWPFVRNLVIYFILFSVLGHWMEMGLCQFIIMGVVQGEYDPTNTMLWRDWLYPFPMEGAAVVLIALILYPLKEWLDKKIKAPLVPYIISFFANAIMCSLIEFSMGLIVNADLQLWDYTDNFGNIMGQVCLQNTLAFGVAASIIAWFVYPLLERLIARIPRDIMNIVFVVVLVFGGIIWSLYIIDPPKGVDMGENAEQSVEEQRQLELESYELMISLQEGMTTSLQDKLDMSEHLMDEERAALQAEIDAINQSVARMYEAIGVDPSVPGEPAEAAEPALPADAADPAEAANPAQPAES